MNAPTGMVLENWRDADFGFAEMRRIFGANEKLVDALVSYVAAMKEVGAHEKAPALHLHAASARMANKEGDNTHFNEKCAWAMADLVVQQLPTAAPRLGFSLQTPQ